MTLGEPTTPALAVGSGVTVLGVTRLLARRGIPVHVGVPDGDLVRTSRRYTAASTLHPSSEALPDYLEGLRLERAVLFPCSDDLAVAAAKLPPSLAQRFPVYQSSEETLQRVIDKGRFLATLEACGTPHPETHLVDSADEVPEFTGDGLQRWFIKPRDSQAFHAHFGVKAFRPIDRRTFESELRRALDAGFGLMIQEYVPGPATHHYFIDGFATDGGEVRAVLARKRLRMWPPDFGNSSYMKTVEPGEVAPALKELRRLLRHLELRGVFSAEFKRDERDGIFRILEINARPWWYIEFAGNAGLDVALMAYQAALGHSIETGAGEYEVGRRLTYPYYDWSACRDASDRLWPALRRMARDWRGADQPVFSSGDPLPALIDALRRVPGVIRRRTRRHGRPAPSQTRRHGS